MDIVEASLLAGVPDEDGEARRPSFDHIRLRLPTVGLHVTGVPNGSSSRAQVHLQVSTRGWYTTMLLSCWATFLLLGAILLHVRTNAINATADIIVVLAGVAAAVATLVAQGEFPGMAGRLLGLPRALAAISTSPWEMAPGLTRPTEKPTGFWDVARMYKYTTPAIRVDSAEAWHHQFHWTEDIETRVQALLSPIRRQP